MNSNRRPQTIKTGLKGRVKNAGRHPAVKFGALLRFKIGAECKGDGSKKRRPTLSSGSPTQEHELTNTEVQKYQCTRTYANLHDHASTNTHALTQHPCARASLLVAAESACRGGRHPSRGSGRSKLPGAAAAVLDDNYNFTLSNISCEYSSQRWRVFHVSPQPFLRRLCSLFQTSLSQSRRNL